MAAEDEEDDMKHLIMDPGKMFQMTIPINDYAPMFQDPKAQADFNTIRKGIGLKMGESRRVDTPDREAIIELSLSYGKKRLKKQQQLLQDLAHRCRVQEISALSGAMSKKCKLSKFESKPMQKEHTFHSGIYNTTKMTGSHRLALTNAGSGQQAEGEKENSSPEQEAGSPRPLFERSNTMFPTRMSRRGIDPSPSRSLPHLHINYTKGVRPDSKPRNNLAQTRSINGPIQLRHYLQPKQDQLSPLVLPSIKFVGYKKDNLENYINSRKILITPRETARVGKGLQSPHYDTVSLPAPHLAKSTTSYGQWSTSRSALGAVNIPPSSPTGKKGSSKYVTS